MHKEKFSLEERRELANIQRDAFELIISRPQVYDHKRDVHDKSDFEKVVDNIEWLDSFLKDNRIISEIDSLWVNVVNRKKQIRNLNNNLIRALMCDGFKEDDAIEIASFSKSYILRSSIKYDLEKVVEAMTQQNELFCDILEDPTVHLLDEVFLCVEENSLPIVKKTSFR
ncbi:MAG: hypothetical protein Q4A23_00510 [bacterium]|nr:hypothetical protein [bacterium]